jgi:hypothetical protein
MYKLLHDHKEILISCPTDFIYGLHSASTKFEDWHYKNYLRERNDTFIV